MKEHPLWNHYDCGIVSTAVDRKKSLYGLEIVEKNIFKNEYSMGEIVIEQLRKTSSAESE